MTTIDLINMNPTTKEEVATFVQKTTALVESGEEDALLLHLKLTAIQKAAEDLKKNIRTHVMDVVNKYPEKTFRLHSCEVEKTETGVEYDYSNCGDPAYAEALAEEEAWKEKRKEREKFLKTLKGPMQICDESTGGETIEVRPPVKTSESFIKVTLK